MCFDSNKVCFWFLIKWKFIIKNLGTSSDFIAVLGLAQKCQIEMAKYKSVKI